jgi:type IV pilus assembly protein PilN
MIRINLLPVRAAKKKETALQQIFILSASVSAVLVVVLALWLVKLGQISHAKDDINASNAKISELKAKIGKLDQIKKLKDEVKKKLDILLVLRKNKTGPATRLATLSDVTPDQLWIEKYKENAGQITVSGLAFNEELIAQFIRALEASSEYEKVELVVSEQKDVSGNKLKRFDLSFKIESLAPVKEQPKK